jgi:RNA polymerase sigma-70 factor (ECF subfamily)
MYAFCRVLLCLPGSVFAGTRPSAREGNVTNSPDSDPVRLSREVERWFLELRDPVFRYLRALGCPHSQAEEIVQEAFLRLHRNLYEGLQVSDVRAWVYRVVRNLWIDTRRDHQRYWMPHVESERPALSYRDPAPDPEQQLLHLERIRLIGKVVSRLPKMERTCVRLKAKGLRYHEIAAVLGISMTAAVDSVRRAVRRLERLRYRL